MALNLLKKILPPEVGTFYSLFEENAEVCSEISKLFQEIVDEGTSQKRTVEVKDLKHRSSAIAKKTLHLLSTTFITPIDREDIQEVACLLNKITRKIVKAGLNLETYRLEAHTECMKNQAANLIQATDELKYNISLLRNISATKEIANSNSKMKEIESRGDEIFHDAMDEIFSGKYEALTVIKLKELYKNIESALDTCFDVSDLVVNIALKNG
jgi:uncharacterized protein